jgi:GDP-L-fucose synthase
MATSMVDLQNATIAVTGGAGFLGQVVCSKLRALGARNVFVPRRGQYDLTTGKGVVRMYEDAAPDIVIHLAAEVGGIGANRANPGRYFFANMAMGLHLIEFGRQRGLEKFLQVGTICAYPDDTPVPFNESNLWSGYPEATNAPYGIAKKALLVMLQAYREQYDFPGIYLLPVNLYGPGDNFDLETSHVIPALIRKLVTAKRQGLPSVEVWGTGKASREFLYVDDCAEGLVLALQHYDGPAPVNLGTGLEITIEALAHKIQGLVGYQGELVWDTTKPDGQPRRCLDVSRAKELFGFEAEVAFDDGLARTIAWWEKEGS